MSIKNINIVKKELPGTRPSVVLELLRATVDVVNFKQKRINMHEGG